MSGVLKGLLTPTLPLMSKADWVAIYRYFDGAELDAVIADCKLKSSTLSQQSMGTKAFTRDLGELRDKLGAATVIRNERNKSNAGQGSGTIDFSDIRR